MENKKSIINAIGTFYMLKTKYVSGNIHKWVANRKEIAKYCGINAKTLVKHINILIDNNFILSDGDSIQLKSYYFLKTKMKFYNLCKYPSARIADRKPNKVTPITSKQMKEELYLLAMQDKNYLMATAKHIANNVNTGKKVSGYCAKDDLSVSNNIGRLGYARAINCKSKTSGQYWIKKFKSKGWLTDKKNSSVLISDYMEIEDYREYVSKTKFLTYRNLYTGVVHQLNPNTIAFIKR